MATAPSETGGSQRVDKWLWYARFRKSRTLAAKICDQGKVRLNGRPISKPHHGVRVGDVLTFPQGRQIKVVRVLALSVRRGPATEAATLYEDLSPDFSKSDVEPSPAQRAPGAGRPTKRERRELIRLRDNSGNQD